MVTNIVEVTHLPVNRTLEFAKKLSEPGKVLTKSQIFIADRILKEIVAPMGFWDVGPGLPYHNRRLGRFRRRPNVYFGHSDRSHLMGVLRAG